MADTLDIDRHDQSLDHALAFFAETEPEAVHRNMAMAALDTPQAGDPFTTGAGLMKFVFNDQTLSDDPAIVKKIDDAKYYLKGMMSLVTAKLFSDNKNNIDAAFQMPPSDVKEVAVHLPLLDAFISKEATNSDSMTTVSFATEIISVLLDVALDDYPAAAAGVQKWLQSTGDQITTSVDITQKTYQVTIFSGVISVTKTGKEIDIEPAFQIAGANLAVSDVKTSILGCVKTQSFKLTYDAPYFRAPFNYDAIEQNATVRAKMDQLVTRGSVDQIDKSGGYFGL